MAKTRKSIRITLYVVLILTGILLHMTIAGYNVGALISDIFARPAGIFYAVGSIFEWTLLTLFSVNGIYLFGTAIVIEFVATPLMQRYKVVTFRTNFAMSVVAAIYFLFLLRMLGVVLGV